MDALAMNLELMGHDLETLRAKSLEDGENIRALLAKSVTDGENISALLATARQDGENIRALARIADMHDRRLSNLEGDRRS